MTELSLGHLAADLAQGALPAILVFLKPALHLTYTMTAAVVLVGTVTSSLAQPFFGHWSDRRHAVWLMPAGVAVASAGIALAGDAPNYVLLLILTGISGFGVGAFHPEAMKIAGHASGERRASGMALFATGGNIGFALGPALTSLAISPLGRSGGLLLVIPGAAIGLMLLIEYGHLAHVRSSRPTHGRGGPAIDQVRAFKRLLVVIGLRSVAYYGLFTFVPLWEVAQGNSKSYGNLLLSLVLLAGVAGTLSAGPLADRVGRRAVLVASMIVTPGLIVVYVALGGVLGAIAVCAAGAAIVSTFGVTIVLSQEYLPSRIAMASGMSVGLATGLGGIAAVGLGAVADAVDLRTALYVTAAGPVLGVLVALALPSDRRRALTSTPAVGQPGDASTGSRPRPSLPRRRMKRSRRTPPQRGSRPRRWRRAG
jgi:MFS transporter, FSR family, fosmidomycin resistance protein